MVLQCAQQRSRHPCLTRNDLMYTVANFVLYEQTPIYQVLGRKLKACHEADPGGAVRCAAAPSPVVQRPPVTQRKFSLHFTHTCILFVDRERIANDISFKCLSSWPAWAQMYKFGHELFASTNCSQRERNNNFPCTKQQRTAEFIKRSPNKISFLFLQPVQSGLGSGNPLESRLHQEFSE